MKKWFPWLIALTAVCALAILGISWTRSATEGSSGYQTVPVKRADLVETISATGTVEPEDLIDVGAQVAGRIVEFGRDSKGGEIDYGSEVKAGMLLARIDDTVYRAEVEQAEAALSNAQATLQRARADVVQLKAKSAQAAGDWERAQKLGPSDALSRSSYEGYRSGAQVAQAGVEMGKAAIKQAEAGIVQARADLNRARQNLSYCTIPSPVDGVIIDRRVNIGQTVVASLSAPSLFLIAKDLKRVQVWVAVNEADIGRIRPGQKVTFTVDAYPGEQFAGRVGKIRLNASMTQNVVTYTVEVATDNADGRLLPYLTANMQFEIARTADALLVPSQALKWSPGSDQKAAARPGKGGREGDAGPRSRQDGQADGRKSGTGRVWVLEGDKLRPVRVDTGMSNGIDTAVSSPELREGMAVVTGVLASGESGQAKASTNPFVPQIPRGRRH